MFASRGRWLLAVLAGAAAYYGAARLGFAISFVHGTVSAVWPPTGIALALVWLGGPRMLPAVFIGELAADLFNGSPLPVSLAFAVGSSAEALTGYGLLLLAGFQQNLERVRDVFALIVLAAGLSTLVSASIGTGTLLTAGTITTGGAWSTWHVWWLGDLTGDVIVAPLVLVLAGTRPRLPRGLGLVETAAFLLTLVALAVVAHELTLGIAYLVLPVLIWAALRFRQLGAVAANTVLASAGVIAAASATSQLARVSVLDRILFTQNFAVVGALTTLVLAALIAERDQIAAALQASASTDELTGLTNQRAFRRRLAEEISRARRYGRPLAVLLLDIDQFKTVNDTAGHLAGDVALAEVAQRIAAGVRGDSLVARVGGDGFAVLLPEASGIEAFAAAERLRCAVASAPFLDHGQRLSISVGVAELEPGDDELSLIGRSDRALYAAKRGGGDACVRHGPAPARMPAGESVGATERDPPMRPFALTPEEVSAVPVLAESGTSPQPD